MVVLKNTCFALDRADCIYLWIFGCNLVNSIPVKVSYLWQSFYQRCAFFIGFLLLGYSPTFGEIMQPFIASFKTSIVFTTFFHLYFQIEKETEKTINSKIFFVFLTQKHRCLSTPPFFKL